MKRTTTVLLMCIGLAGCSTLLGSAIPLPNPLEEDKGLKVNAQVGKTNTLTDKKQLGEVNLSSDSRDYSNTSNVADSIAVQNSNTESYIIYLLCLMSGLAIPTRSQYKQIKLLKETLAHERQLNDRNIQVIANSDTRGHEHATTKTSTL